MTRSSLLLLLCIFEAAATFRCGVGLQRPPTGAVSRSSGVRALEADASPAVVSVSDRSVECELCVPIADGAATRTMLITLQSENDASEQAVNLADKIGVEAAELEAELIECWRGAVTPVRKPKRKPRLVRPRAPEAEGAPWTVDVTCPWCENPISLALEGAVDRWAKKRPIKCMMDGQQDLHLVGKDRPKRSRKCPGFVLERAKAADDGSPQLEVKSAPMPLDGPCALMSREEFRQYLRGERELEDTLPLRGDLKKGEKAEKAEALP